MARATLRCASRAAGPGALWYGLETMSPIAQAGAIAARRNGSRVEVLIARAKKNPLEWIFPKGHIEDEETAEHAALRELQEEAGVAGHIVRPLGASVFLSARGQVEVAYFLVRFTGT